MTDTPIWCDTCGETTAEKQAQCFYRACGTLVEDDDPPAVISVEEADARVAAALREVADRARQELVAAWAADLIEKWCLSLIPDAGAALDRALREAEARGMERAASKIHAYGMWFLDCNHTGNGYDFVQQAKEIRAEAAAIRAQEGE